MKRRDFLATAALTTTLSTAMDVSADGSKGAREFVEFRTYTVRDDEKKRLLLEMLDKAFIPALNAQGIRPVGVFVPIETEKKYQKNVFVVIPHKTLETFLSLTSKLLADETYRRNAATLFSASSKDPVFETCESQLLCGFETCPTLEMPDLGKDRVFQTRLYRSCNIDRNAAKIRMFDHGGELATFRKVGLHPIFFGEALTGKKLPNLTYLVGCENLEKHNEAWKTFVSHPDWLKIRDLPEYADTATEIDRVVLLPSPGSQI